MVTGYDEAVAVYHDTASFSSCTSVTGPFPGFPVPLEGDDVERAHRATPRRVADERPTPHARPARAHGAPRVAHAAHHPEAAEGERGVHVAAGRPPTGRVRRERRVRIHPRVRQALRHARDRRPPRSTRNRSRTVPQRHRRRAHRHARQHRRPDARAQPVGVPRRTVHDVHRGPAPEPARRRAHRARHGDVPRREHTRGHRRRAHRRQPVRRRPGNDGAPARGRAAPARRATRPPRHVARASAT